MKNHLPCHTLLTIILFGSVLAVSACQPANRVETTPAPTRMSGSIETDLPSSTILPSSTPTSPAPTLRPSPTAIVETGLETITSDSAQAITNIAMLKYETHPYRLAFIPDGSKLVAIIGDWYSRTPPTTVQIIDGRTGAVLFEYSIATDPTQVWVTADGLRILAYVKETGLLSAFDSLTGELETEQKIGVIDKGWLNVSADGRRVAYNKGDDRITLWDVRRDQQVTTFRSVGFRLPPGFTPDGQLFVDEDSSRYKVYDTETGQTVAELADKSNWISNIWQTAFSPDSSKMAIAGDDRGATVMLQVWDLRNGRRLASWQDTVAAPVWGDLAYSPDGLRLACTLGPSNVQQVRVNVFDAESLQPIADWEGHTSLAFTHDNLILADAKEDGVIQLWDSSGRPALVSLTGHSLQDVKELLFSSDGKRLVSRGNHMLRFWGIPAGGQPVARAGLEIIEKDTGVFNMATSIPAGWLAQGSPPLYRLELETQQDVLIKNCRYEGDHILGIWQNSMTATLSDNQTGEVIAQRTFHQPNPTYTCPSTRVFNDQTEAGGILLSDKTEFEAWIIQTMQALGFDL